MIACVCACGGGGGGGGGVTYTLRGGYLNFGAGYLNFSGGGGRGTQTFGPGGGAVQQLGMSCKPFTKAEVCS